MVHQESQSANGDNQKLHPERVMVPVISCLELHVDQVHRGIRTSNIDELEGQTSVRAMLFFSKPFSTYALHLSSV